MTIPPPAGCHSCVEFVGYQYLMVTDDYVSVWVFLSIGNRWLRAPSRIERAIENKNSTRSGDFDGFHCNFFSTNPFRRNFLKNASNRLAAYEPKVGDTITKNRNSTRNDDFDTPVDFCANVNFIGNNFLDKSVAGTFYLILTFPIVSPCMTRFRGYLKL